MIYSIFTQTLYLKKTINQEVKEDNLLQLPETMVKCLFESDVSQLLRIPIF